MQHRIEYLILRGVSLIVSPLPYRLALSIGWMLAWLGHFILKYRVHAARERIREVFGDSITEREVRRIGWISWRNFIFGAIDMFRLRRIDIEWIQRHIIDWQTIRDRIHTISPPGHGAVFACPHMGSLEIPGIVFQQFGLPIFFLTAPQKNPLTGDYIERNRGITGIPVVQRGSSQLRSTIGRLRQGEILYVPVDLRVAQNGIPVQFLGKEASVGPGMSLFSKRIQVPIIPFISNRIGWSKHSIQVFDPILPDPDMDKLEDQQRLTQEVFNIFEKAIRENPEQWFWYNKSWILEPAEDKTN